MIYRPKKKKGLGFRGLGFRALPEKSIIAILTNQGHLGLARPWDKGKRQAAGSDFQLYA